MEKLDFKKKYKDYYSATETPKIIELKSTNYLTIQGMGEPGGKAFQESTEVLYPVAYTIKKYFKLTGKDFGVPPLEGLWWTIGNKPASQVPREQWHWKLAIRMPNGVNHDLVTEAISEVLKKKKKPLADQVALETMKEGKCVQILHIGPYADEQKTINRLYEFIKTSNLQRTGLHHEIYLNDPRKVEPAKIKTIIRQSVK